MSTSQHSARIRWPSTWPSANDAIGPVVARDVAVNNVNHYSDVFGQCRANFAPCALSGPGYIQSTSALTNEWSPIWTSGPFSACLMPDGQPYRLRVHLAGSNGGSTTKARFAVILGRVNTTRSYTESGGTVVASDAVWLSAETSTSTAAYLTGSSQGTGAYARMCSLTAVEGSRAMVMGTTITGVSGASVGVLQCMLELVVYAQHENASNPARLHAFSAWEVVP